jgi:DNA repair protein RecN (Recombination protein N)
MLLHLTIRNFILIKSLDLSFINGFYAITGETGAGKSILLNALRFVLGQKLDTNPVGNHDEFCSVIAEFSSDSSLNKILEESGIFANDTLIIKRQFFLDGKKKYYINNEPVTLKLVNEITESLIEIYGQHSQGILLQSSAHRELLDKFGNYQELQDTVTQKYNDWKLTYSQIAELNKNQANIEKDIDFLSFVVSELNDKCPKFGEEEELANLRINLQQRQKSTELIKELKVYLEKFGISHNIQTLIRTIEKKQHNISDLDPILEKLFTSAEILHDAESDLDNLLHNVEDSEFDNIESRLFEIRALSRKYNIPSNELENYYKQSKEKLDFLENAESNFEKLKLELERKKLDYFESASQLSQKRHQSAVQFTEEVMKEFKDLDLLRAEIKVLLHLKTESSYNSYGIDEVKFLVSTNPGMLHLALDKVASGGEISRIMLAITSVLFKKFSKHILVFDEIDTGIGGSVAESIGEKLRSLSSNIQVFAITHQPQVASLANYHLFVEKSIDQENSVTTAKILDQAQREMEIARMISGKNINKHAIEAAKEMIKS